MTIPTTSALKSQTTCKLIASCLLMQMVIYLVSFAALKKDFESMKTRYNEASDKLMEKSRQFQKLQVCSPALFLLFYEVMVMVSECGECVVLFNPLSTKANCFRKQESVYKVLTPNIKPPI